MSQEKQNFKIIDEYIRGDGTKCLRYTNGQTEASIVITDLQGNIAKWDAELSKEECCPPSKVFDDDWTPPGK